MSIGKHRTSLGESIHGRCPHLRVTFKGTDPIIEVINGDEQNIWLIR
jgi:hypothetical protein